MVLRADDDDAAGYITSVHALPTRCALVYFDRMRKAYQLGSRVGGAGKFRRRGRGFRPSKSSVLALIAQSHTSAVIQSVTVVFNPS